MNIKFKVMSKTAIAAVIASAAIVPAMAVPTAAATVPVSDVVYSVNGQNTSLELPTFTSATNAGVLTNLDIKYVKSGAGEFFNFSDFTSALNAFDGDPEKAIDALTKSDKKVTVTDVVTGTVDAETGTVVPDTTADEFKVESIAAINETSVTVNFPSNSEIAEDDLTGKTITLKAGETTLTATYEPASLTESKATFVLAEGETLVVDTEYAVTSEDLTIGAEAATVKFTTPDTEAPVLSYDGETELTVENGAEFEVPEVTVTDNKDEEVAVTTTITNSEDAVLEAIDTTVAGVYTITYTAVDAAGNEAEAVVVTVTVEKSATQVELEAAVTAAEEALAVIEFDQLNAGNVKNFKEQIEAARAAVDAVTKLDADTVVEGTDKLVAAEALLDSVTAEVANLKTVVQNDTRSVDVAATIKNLEADIVTVALYATDEDGVKDGAAIEEVIVLSSELDEDNGFTTSLDLKDKLTVKKGSYIVEVTAAEGEATSTVAIDFTAADLIVKTVNEAASELALEDALAGFTGFDSANITEYRVELGTATGLEGQITAKTVAEIQETIETVNMDVKEATLVAELQTLAAGPQKALLTKLQEKFVNVDAKNIVHYQNYLLDEEVFSDLTFSPTVPVLASDVQKAINLINVTVNFKSAKTVVEAATAKIATNPKQVDVDAAKVALEAFKAADKAKQLVADPEGTYAPDLAIATEQGKITAAEVKIADAKTEAETLATAISEAKAAQKAHLLAGGKKEDVTYVAVTTAITVDPEAGEIDSAKDALVVETNKLNAKKDAKAAATKAKADFVAAGGLKTAVVYTAVTDAVTADETAGIVTANTALDAATASLVLYNEATTTANEALDAHVAAGGTLEDTQAADLKATLGTVDGTEVNAAAIDVKTAAITSATPTLTAETVKLTAVTDAKAAAEKALTDYVAAGGKAVDSVYTAVSTKIDALNNAGIPALETAITALNKETAEKVAVSAINAAVTAEDAVALQNIIVNLNVTEFANLSKAQRAEIGAFMIRASKEEGYEAVTTTTAFKSSVTSAISDYTTKVGAFNTAANTADPINATTKKAVIDAIKAVTDLQDMTASQELDLAERIFESKPEAPGYAVKTIAEIEALVNATPYSVK